MRNFRRQEDGLEVSDVSEQKTIEQIAVEFGEGAWEEVAPAQEDPKLTRRFQIESQLAALDLKAIRPLLDGDTDRVNAIKSQKEALRSELNAL